VRLCGWGVPEILGGGGVVYLQCAGSAWGGVGELFTSFTLVCFGSAGGEGGRGALFTYNVLGQHGVGWGELFTYNGLGQQGDQGRGVLTSSR